MKTVRRSLGVLVATLALLLGLLGLAPTPAGAAAPKYPVLIVTGFTTGPLIEPGYYPLRTRLQAAGYTTEIVAYPDYGMGDIHVNAGRLRDRVNAILARTGAPKVDLVAHSMGGLVSRDYIKYLGGSTKVRSLTTLGTPNYGTELANVVSFFSFGSCVGITACRQMARGSAYLNDLNAGDDSIGNVRYTNIATSVDEIVFPYTTSYLNAADGNIANIKVQSQCWNRWPGHLGLIGDGAVADGIRDALRQEPVRMNCLAL